MRDRGSSRPIGDLVRSARDRNARQGYASLPRARTEVRGMIRVYFRDGSRRVDRWIEGREGTFGSDRLAGV